MASDQYSHSLTRSRKHSLFTHSSMCSHTNMCAGSLIHCDLVLFLCRLHNAAGQNHGAGQPSATHDTYTGQGSCGSGGGRCSTEWAHSAGLSAAAEGPSNCPRLENGAAQNGRIQQVECFRKGNKQLPTQTCKSGKRVASLFASAVGCIVSCCAARCIALLCGPTHAATTHRTGGLSAPQFHPVCAWYCHKPLC